MHIYFKDINNRRHNQINQLSIWGSKALNSKKYIINKNKSNSINYSNIIDNDIIIKDKNQNNKIKQRNNILKFLIEFNKSRKEAEGKYFDIWLDKSYYYYLALKIIKEKLEKNIMILINLKKTIKNIKKLLKEMRFRKILK